MDEQALMPNAGSDARRGTIFLERAPVLEQRAFPGAQHILRVAAPKTARSARPGTFAHLRCDEHIPLRRPLSIMRADAGEGWIEFLYKIVGRGLEALAERRPGDEISVLAPIGNGFTPDPARPDILALGGGVGIPPVLFLADRLRERPEFRMLVIMGSEVPFPFDVTRASRDVPGLPADATHGLTLLEGWGVPSRLASLAGLEGCHRGYVTAPGRSWLAARTRAELERTQLVACGPEPMLRAAAKLAREFGLPCQLALEEYMACGVGGCAGCTVLLQTPSGAAMKRVCVDGPVFPADEVYPRGG